MIVDIKRIAGIPCVKIGGDFEVEETNGYKRYVCNNLTYTKFGKTTIYERKKNGERYIEKKMPTGEYLRVIIK